MVGATLSLLRPAICPGDSKKIYFAGAAGAGALRPAPERAQFFAGERRVPGRDGRTRGAWCRRPNDL